MNFRPWRGFRTNSKKQLRRQNEQRRRSYVAREHEHLLFEPLEWRNLMTVTLRNIVGNDAGGLFNVPAGKTLYVPLTGADSVSNATVSYAAQSSNAGIKLEVLDGNPTLVLNVQGVDGDGNNFSGKLTIELFDDIAPITVQTITSYVNAGDYDGKSFYRVIQDFMIQGGYGQTANVKPNFADEFDAQASFNSPGLLAMANSGPGTNSSEFFITDIDRPLNDSANFLNFKHTIFGQLTGGFDIYQKIIGADVTGPDNDQASPPIIITDASIISGGDQAAVLKITAAPDFDGNATITVTASTSAGSSTAVDTFGVDFSPSGAPSNNRPIVIGAVGNKTVQAGKPVEFQISATAAGSLALKPLTVTGTNGFRGAPQNVTVVVTPGSSNGNATVRLTPAAGFSGKIELVVHADDTGDDWHDAILFTLEVLPPVIDPVEPINSSTGNSITVSGEGSEGATISVEVTDGTNTVTGTATVGQNGIWTSNAINISTLNQGNITYKATDTTNNVGAANVVGVKDTIAPTVAINPIEFVNGGNQNSFTVSGTSEAGAIITLVISDGSGPNVTPTPATVVANSSGIWTFTGINLSGLDDGAITFTATATDAAGNTGAEDVEDAVMDTDAPDAAILNASNVKISNSTSASINGTTDNGETVTITVTVSDGTTTTAPQTITTSNGAWSFSNLNLTSLADGDITYQITAKDAAGNETMVTRAAIKSALGITNVTDPINIDNEDSVSISGTSEPEAGIMVEIRDADGTLITRTTTVTLQGTWSITGIDLNTLDDGAITFKVIASDGENTIDESRTVNKDTVAPIVTITDSSITKPVNNGNKTNVSVGGTVTGIGTGGGTINIVIDDNDNTTAPVTRTVTVNSDGTWTASGINVTNLKDGTLTIKVTATDAAENVSTEKTADTTKDTVAPIVVITDSSLPDSITPANVANSSISGTAEAGSTVTLVIRDSNGLALSTLTTQATNGTWSFTGINMGALADGEITYTVTATDAAGNAGTDTASVDKSIADNSISGRVYLDLNGNGKYNSRDVKLRGVLITLHGVGLDGKPIPSRTTTTDSNGRYRFDDLPAGTYTIREAQPTGMVSKATNLGTAGGKAGANVVKGIVLDGSEDGENYNFGEKGFSAGSNVVSIRDFLASSPPAQVVYDVAMTNRGTAVPVVTSIRQLDANPNTANQVKYRVTFSKGVTGVALDDFFIIPNTSITGMSIAGITAVGKKTYDVTVNSGTGTGLLGIELRDNNSIKDSKGKSLGGGGVGDGSFFSPYYNVADVPTVSLGTTNTVTNANKSNYTVSGSVGSITNGQSTTITVEIDDVGNASTPKITRTTTVSANGSWTISGINLSDFSEGVLKFNVFATNSLGKSVEVKRDVNKDTTGPALAITGVVPNPVGSTDLTVNISGTGEIGRSVTVVINDNEDGTAAVQPAAVIVDNQGNWTVLNVNVGSLDDGQLTVTATSSDVNGNQSTDTENITKDVAAPAVTINQLPAINSGNQEAIDVGGTGEVGAKVLLTISNGSNVLDILEATVGTDGNWAINDIDVSDLPDGTIKFLATATDAANNPATASRDVSKDATAPAVAINTPPTINAANEEGIMVSGTGENGAIIKLTVSKGNQSLAVLETTVASGVWTITVNPSTLDDGTINFSVTATDTAGNVSAPDTDTAVKDTVAPTVAVTEVDPINLNNQDTASAEGTVEAGSTVMVTASDGTTTTTGVAAIVSGTTWTVTGINVSALKDGPITFTATATDAAGNTATHSLAGTKSTVLITSVTDPIVFTNQEVVVVSGTGQPGTTVTLVVKNGANELGAGLSTTILNDGTWQIGDIDVTSLADGTITFVATAELNGDTASSTKTAPKDTIPPDVLTIGTVTSPINAGNETNTSINGTTDPGSTVEVIVTDGNTTIGPFQAVVQADGSWAATGIDVSSLFDATLTYTVTAKDSVGNQVQTSRTSNKDTVVDNHAINFATTPINAANEANTSASGTTEPGSTVSVVATDGVNSSTPVLATVELDGSWTVSGINVSTLAEGPITYRATATDGAGNTATAEIIVSKDTEAPSVAIGSVSDPVNAGNVTTVSIQGTGEAGSLVSVIVGDGVTSTTAATVPVAGDGTWSISSINVSALADGPITYTAVIEDASGNSSQTTESATKDVLPPTVQSITLADPNPTSENTVLFTVVFTEPVTGVGSSSFLTVAGGDVTGVSIDSVVGSLTTYTVAVSFTSGTGSLGLNVDDIDLIFDTSMNPLGGVGNDNGDFIGEAYTIE